MESISAVKLLHESGSISTNIIFMTDEMHLQQSTQYHGCQYVGKDNDGNLYKGTIVFMIVGLQESVPTVVRDVPETSVNGKFTFLSEEQY